MKRISALLALVIGYVVFTKLRPAPITAPTENSTGGILLETILISLYGLRFEEDV